MSESDRSGQKTSFEATTTHDEKATEKFAGPLVHHSSHSTPQKILIRPTKDAERKAMVAAKIVLRFGDEDTTLYVGIDQIRALNGVGLRST